MATAKLTSKGQVTIPKDIRDELGVMAGDEIEFVKEAGVITVRRPFNREKLEKLRKEYRLHPYFRGKTTDEVIEEMRGPVDLG